MPSTVTLKAAGLNTNPNQLELPEGSLIEAKNVVINRENIIQPRRGFKLFGESFGTSEDRAKQMWEYKERIIRHYSNKLQFQNGELNDGTANFDTFDGDYLEAQLGLRIKHVDSAGNLFFTTSEGIKKISAKSGSQFSTAPGYIVNAGGIKAVDFVATLQITPNDQTGFLPQDAAVAYRVVWGTRDANDNLILGTPSQREVVYNPLSSLLVQDFTRVLSALDKVSDAGGSLIDDGDYTNTLRIPVTATAVEIRNSLISLSAKIDQDLLFANDTGSGVPLTIDPATSKIISSGIYTINFSSGDPTDYFEIGDKIYLSGFSSSTETDTLKLDGVQTIASVDSTSITIVTTVPDTIKQIEKITTVAKSVTEITTTSGAFLVSGAAPASYFTINSANNAEKYYVWYKVGSSTDPAVAGRIGIQVNASGGDTAATVANSTISALNAFPSAFVATLVSGSTLRVTLVNSGITDDANSGTSGFSFSISNTLQNKYFFINQVDGNGYYVWYNVDGGGVDPGPFAPRTAVPISILSSSTSEEIAVLTSSALGALSGTPYITSSIESIITITHSVPGAVASASDSGATEFTFSTPTAGAGDVAITSGTITSGTYRNIPEPSIPETPTPDSQLVELQTYLETILTDLRLESNTGTPPRISSSSQTAFIDPLDATTSAQVKLTITIPDAVNSNYFIQIYRSAITQATGTTSIDDIVPNDELQLVYEAYPTSTEISDREMTVIDNTPDDFRGANLYTNASTGEGILQANDLPPFALDINRFKNVVFYANTRTRQKKSLNFISAQNLIDDYNNGDNPRLSIVTSLGSNTYFFVTGENEVTDITTTDASFLASSGTASYFTINSAENEREYYVWYNIGTAADPAISGKTGIEVVVDSLDLASVVADRTRDSINSYPLDFSASSSTNVITVTLTKAGYTDNATAGTSGFGVVVTTEGRGEDASQNQVLISSSVSVATAVDETTRSLVRIINKNTSETLYAYYLSGPTDVPGKFSLEAKTLDDIEFFLVTNDALSGASFTPDISPTIEIISITTGLNPVITTVANHNLVNNEQIIITLTNSTPVIDGVYNVKVLSPTTFTIELQTAITIAGTEGVAISTLDAITSENERKINRIYYSKLSQPEAVPLLNYLDVGDSDKNILRIFPLRDSLFVFKEDGVYRISGETSPFTLALFDSSCILTAPDSLDVSNNLLYCLTTQGVSAISEGGVESISIPIDNTLERSKALSNYKTLSFGVGYESDLSYILYTITSEDDENATIGYRYSTRTNTWTVFDKSVTCGFVNKVDDKLYHGPGDINQIEQERKDFTRTDYADREYVITLSANDYIGNILRFISVSNIQEGDVLVQSQSLTVYEYNSLLQKLDFDPGVGDSDYFSELESFAGDSLRNKIVQLATKLDADPDLNNTNYLSSIDSKTGTITGISIDVPTVITCVNHGLLTGRYIQIVSSNSTPSIDGSWEVTKIDNDTFSIPTVISLAGSSGTFSTFDASFQDILGCYNILIDNLNNDDGASFSNYKHSTTTTDQEAVVLSVDKNQKKVTLNLTLDFIQGPITQYKGIDTSVTYGPILFGDPVNYKHLREATIMFINKAFTAASMSFYTDLLPQFIPIPFDGDGNGIFGHSQFGSGFFGGNSHGAPFRTYIPRQCQRCRYIVVNFEHLTARESYGIYGVSITGENTGSARAYRG